MSAASNCNRTEKVNSHSHSQPCRLENDDNFLDHHRRRRPAGVTLQCLSMKNPPGKKRITALICLPLLKYQSP